MFKRMSFLKKMKAKISVPIICLTVIIFKIKKRNMMWIERQKTFSTVITLGSKNRPLTKKEMIFSSKNFDVEKALYN